jgi:hypothetical protein
MTTSRWSEGLILALLGAALVAYIVMHWPLVRATLIVARHLLQG